MCIDDEVIGLNLFGLFQGIEIFLMFRLSSLISRSFSRLALESFCFGCSSLESFLIFHY